jgi:hypothetical protein
MAKRNYKKEYRSYQGKPAQIKRRAKRNAARRKMMRLGRVRKGDGKDVNHKRPGNLSNKTAHLSVTSKSVNRGFRRNSKGKNLGLAKGPRKKR